MPLALALVLASCGGGESAPADPKNSGCPSAGLEHGDVLPDRYAGADPDRGGRGPEREARTGRDDRPAFSGGTPSPSRRSTGSAHRAPRRGTASPGAHLRDVGDPEFVGAFGREVLVHLIRCGLRAGIPLRRDRPEASARHALRPSSRVRRATPRSDAGRPAIRTRVRFRRPLRTGAATTTRHYQPQELTVRETGAGPSRI